MWIAEDPEISKKKSGRTRSQLRYSSVALHGVLCPFFPASLAETYPANASAYSLETAPRLLDR